MARVRKMIQSINHKGLHKTQELGNALPKKIEHGQNKTDQRILNIYEEHLSVSSPTYSEDVKEIMKNKEIEDSNLNAKIVEIMNDRGVDVSKDALNIVVNQLQKEHLFGLFQKGYNIEELTIDIIASEIMQSEQGPVLAGHKESVEDIDQEIIQALAEAGLPATSKNIERLEQYKDKLEDIIDDSDITVSNMLRHQSGVTVNNLYTAKHQGVSKGSQMPPTQEQIIAVLAMNHIAVSQENINAARNLMSGSIEVTKGNIESVTNMKAIINDIDVSELIKKGAKEMTKGNNPGDMSLGNQVASTRGYYEYDEMKEIVEEIIQDIPNMDETVIEKTYKNGEPITIENLQKTLHENIEKAMGHQESRPQDLEKTPQLATTKRKLEEIRLSLTLDAALKLNHKLDIQTADLSQVVAELKVLKKQQNEEILTNIGAPVTEENLEAMEQTNKRIYNIAKNKEIAVVEVIKDEIDFTLEGMDEAIKLETAQNIYEETASKPESRFGEGITKVEEQIEHVLEMNDIEVTDVNVKAGKALVQSNIDISQEAVDLAKGVLVKIETVLYEMQPAVVAQMLQEGIKPDTVPIDHLIEHIRALGKESNVNPIQRVAEAILELDQSNQLNSEQREGLIAVYRMLNTISKNETAAIGFLLDHEKEPTLGNLFEASKYIKKIGSQTGQMDIRVDDDLGMREGDLPKNIRHLIQEATTLPGNKEDIEQWLNTRNVIDQWLSRITPEELKKYIHMDKSLEALELKDGRLSDFEAERTTKQLEALEKVSPHTLPFLKEQKIALTIPNIYWTDQMIKDPYLLGSMLKEYETLTDNKIDTSINGKGSKENIEEILEQLEKELEGQSHTWLSAPESSQAYNTGRELVQMLNTQRQVFKNEGIYQVPVELHHGMSNLNVYVINDKQESSTAEKDELKAYLSIKTQNIGVIQVHMRICDQSLAFEMIGETPEVTLGLQKDSKSLQAAIEKIGYNVRQAKFSQGKTEKSLIEKPKLSEGLLKYRFDDSKFEHII